MMDVLAIHLDLLGEGNVGASADLPDAGARAEDAASTARMAANKPGGENTR